MRSTIQGKAKTRIEIDSLKALRELAVTLHTEVKEDKDSYYFYYLPKGHSSIISLYIYYKQRTLAHS